MPAGNERPALTSMSTAEEILRILLLSTRTPSFLGMTAPSGRTMAAGALFDGKDTATPPRRRSGAYSAVDKDVDTGDVAGLGADEELHNCPDVLRRADSADCRQADHLAHPVTGAAR